MTDDSRPIFVAKGVGAFFGFLLLFFGVSAYLGGGITGVEVSVVLAAIVVATLIILWPKLREQTQTVQTDGPAQVEGTSQVCPPGPHDVVYGETTKLELNVKEGNRLAGFVREVNSDFFDWCIVDEDNLVRFFDGKSFSYIDGEKNTVVSKVHCQVPHSGPWYLLLDIGSRQNDREVEVSLRIDLK